MNLFLGSAAEVIKLGIIKLLTAKNTEEVIVASLASFIKDVGYAEMMPNFDTVHISTISPFALMLYQEVQGQKASLNVFPSITIADMNTVESEATLSGHTVDAVVDASTVAWIKAEKSAGKIFIADSNIVALENATADGNQLSSTRKTVTKRATFVFSIWSENKEITSLLYDIVGAYLVDKQIELHNEDIDIFQQNGSKTGDVNMEFGALLYGASYNVDAMVQQTVMTIDVDSGVITKVTVIVDPESDTGDVATSTATVTKE